VPNGVTWSCARAGSSAGRRRAGGSFFLTGDFLTNTGFKPLVQRIVREGHYLGPHSDKHVLYCPWEGPKKTLVTHAEFRADLESNLGKIERFGIPRRQIRYFLPPYEYYNQEIVDWAKELGLTLVNYTPARARMRITPARRRRTSSPHRPSSTASLPGRSRTQTV
jgi:peptidoglycan/xylan/chitin deacetylase (PgdA/CDA1 family)